MSKLVRVTMSLEESLMKRLEKLVESSRYTNRSEFIRDMIRERLVQQAWDGNEDAVGTVTLVYNHHKRKLTQKLTELQHHHHTKVLAVTHVHLDEHLCAETILMRGRAREIRQLADLLRQQKGVLHASLSTSSTGQDLD
ncbi:MAG: nickel-responsive transcriptional regulator NikR [Deltaproteobacteria bacterium]|nr:nickel-responsive transcriptional regulator NikR [Deltaproteobacteria bacterium]